MIYVDTSVLTAYYAPEPLSEDAENLMRSEPLPAISDLVELELFSALARKVRNRELPAADAERIRAEFLSHLEAELYLRLPVEREHYRLAQRWLAAVEPPLRSLDALHLAVAARSRRQLVTADRGLSQAAARLGLEVRLIEQGSTWEIHQPEARYGEG